MTDETHKEGAGVARLLAATVLAALCLATGALGADRTDTSFGQNGLAISPLPQKAALAEAGIQDLAAAPEGKMAAAIAGLASVGYLGAARFNEDGSLDRSFGSEGLTADYEVPPLGPASELPPGDLVRDEQKTQAQGVAVQADGKVVVVGFVEMRFSDNSRLYAPVLVRYDAAGSLDPSFGEAGAVAPKAENELAFRKVLHAVAVAPTGRIIGVGSMFESQYGYHRRPLVTAYTPPGEIDRSFGRNGQVVFRVPPGARHFGAETFTAVKVLASGKILLAGYLHGRLSLARLLANGKHDKSFGGGDGKVSLRIEEPVSCCGEWASLALQRNGRVLLAGVVRGPAENHLALARFRPNGRLDRSFGKGGLVAPSTTLRMPHPRDLAVQGNGRIVVVGYGYGVTKREPGALAFRALRYMPNGALDRSFGSAGLQLLHPAAQNAALAALTQASGRVVAGGVLATLEKGDPNESELLLTRYLSGPAH